MTSDAQVLLHIASTAAVCGLLGCGLQLCPCTAGACFLDALRLYCAGGIVSGSPKRQRWDGIGGVGRFIMSLALHADHQGMSCNPKELAPKLP
ncbi:MAG: hypothetical protein H8E62_05880, partial [Planctomycetes bacterium]|nr:hypothetical protein [Planctomycetota bacterium]